MSLRKRPPKRPRKARSKKPTSNRAGFTLVEIMIVAAVIALLAVLAMPGFIRARKRAQAGRVINDLRQIESATEQYALENSKLAGAAINTADWTAYAKKGSALYNTGSDLFGNGYGVQTVDLLPNVPQATWNTLSDVAGSDFFSPLGHY